jgi:hypothetical protein
MPLISKTITGMYGGVSQQPAALRLDNQCEEMINCVPSIVDGVRKRHPTEYIENLDPSTSVDADTDMKLHFIDRDDEEKYVAMFTGDATEPIEVYSLLDGEKRMVKYLSYNQVVGRSIGSAVARDNLFARPGFGYESPRTTWPGTTTNPGPTETEGMKFAANEYVYQAVELVRGVEYRVGVGREAMVVDNPTGWNSDFPVEVHVGSDATTNYNDIAEHTTGGIFTVPAGAGSTMTVYIRLTYMGTRLRLPFTDTYVYLPLGTLHLFSAHLSQSVADEDIPPDTESLTYATPTSPTADLRLLTIGDNTIVVNRTIRPEMSDVIDVSVRYPIGIVYVKHGVASTTYSVTVDGVKASFTTGLTSAPDTWKTSNIASELKTAITGLIGTTDYTITQDESVIIIFKPDGTDFTLAVHDSWGEAALVGVKGEAEKLEDLPPRMPNFTETGRYQVKINQLSQAFANRHMLYVLGAVTFSVIVNGNTYSITDYVVSDHDAAYLQSDQKISAIAVALAAKIQAGEPTLTVTTNRTLIDIWDTSGASVTCVDNSAIRTVEGYTYDPLTVTAISTNTSAQEAVIVKVGSRVQDPDQTGYYLGWTETTDDGVNMTGRWKETKKSGMRNSFDADTMPHTLRRESDGTFTFAPIIWSDRTIGDEDTAPEPSFIGKVINDVFFHKNRLGFVGGESVVLSAIDDYFNFWPMTSLEILDDDPIDVTIPTTGVDAILWAIPHRADVLAFGRNTQFLVTAGEDVAFTARTISSDQNTNYAISAAVGPRRRL